MSSTEQKEPWRWDGPRFGRWLRRWRDAEHLSWAEIATSTGLHISTLQGISRGTSQRTDGKSLDPPISTVVRLAQGLGLELDYVVRQAGIDPHNDRWSNFNGMERATLREVLRFHAMLEQAAGLEKNPLVPRLLNEVEASLPSIKKEEEEADAH